MCINCQFRKLEIHNFLRKIHSSFATNCLIINEYKAYTKYCEMYDMNAHRIQE